MGAKPLLFGPQIKGWLVGKGSRINVNFANPRSKLGTIRSFEVDRKPKSIAWIPTRRSHGILKGILNMGSEGGFWDCRRSRGKESAVTVWDSNQREDSVLTS
jgi:hypothetical protein